MHKRFRLLLLVAALAALALWAASSVVAQPQTPPDDRFISSDGPSGSSFVLPEGDERITQAHSLALHAAQLTSGTLSLSPLSDEGGRQRQQASCGQLLLNPQLDVLELGDGEGRAEPWAIFDPAVYYSSASYVSPEYSLGLKDADTGDESPEQDAFAQAFYMPSGLTSVTIHYYVATLDTNGTDRALGNLWTVDADGNLIDCLGHWLVPESESQWYEDVVEITDPSALAPMAGQRIAIILFNDTDGQAPGEEVWFDDVTLTACRRQLGGAVYLPLVLRDYGTAAGPACYPPSENPQDQWNANRGRVEADAVCNSTLSKIDLADYYSFQAPRTENYTLRLGNLPSGTEWAAMIFVDQAKYPPPYAPGPVTGHCRIDQPGSGDKKVTCPLQGGKAYFIKVSAGASYSGGLGAYRMQMVSSSGPQPTATPTPTPSPTPESTPTRTPTPTQEPAGITNGDFEDGPVGWEEESSHGWPLIVNEFPGSITPHGGSWAAWLGGEYDDVSILRQQVTVPSSSFMLTYWHWIASEEPSYSDPDWAQVIVDGIVVDAYALRESANTGGWVLHDVDLSAYTGQSVSLELFVLTDGEDNSNLFIDDVAFARPLPRQSGPTVSSFDPENALPKSDDLVP